MTKPQPDLSEAVSLMRMALSLLDEMGETCVAAHLQHAIDIATHAPVPLFNRDG